MVLDQLAKVTGEDTHLDDATRAKRDQLAQAFRESEETAWRKARAKGQASPFAYFRQKEVYQWHSR